MHAVTVSPVGTADSDFSMFFSALLCVKLNRKQGLKKAT